MTQILNSKEKSPNNLHKIPSPIRVSIIIPTYNEATLFTSDR